MFLAVTLFALPPFVASPRPASVIEQLLQFNKHPPGNFASRSYAVSPGKIAASRLQIYEGARPMARSDEFWFTVEGGAYIARVKPADGSDPRSNGRKYWIAPASE